jgi:hypothetical protein
VQFSWHDPFKPADLLSFMNPLALEIWLYILLGKTIYDLSRLADELASWFNNKQRPSCLLTLKCLDCHHHRLCVFKCATWLRFHNIVKKQESSLIKKFIAGAACRQMTTFLSQTWKLTFESFVFLCC